MGDNEKALHLYGEAKKIQAKALGTNHPDYATILNNMAGLYKWMGDYDLAERMYEETKKIRAAAFGVESPDYATTLNNMAAMYTAMAYFDKAEPLFEEAKAIRAKTLGEDHELYKSTSYHMTLMMDMKNDTPRKKRKSFKRFPGGNVVTTVGKLSPPTEQVKAE